MVTGTHAQTEADKIEIYNSVLYNIDSLVAKPEDRFLIIEPTCIIEIETINFLEDTSILRRIFNIPIDAYEIVDIINNTVDFSSKTELLPEEMIFKDKLKKLSYDSLLLLYKKCSDSTAISTGEKLWSYIHDTIKYNGFCRLSRPYFYNASTAIAYLYWLKSSSVGAAASFFYINSMANG